MKLWQLKNPKTGENIGGLQPLPENWGPIFGMEGVKDRLGDLSWLGIDDRCWIEVDAPKPITNQETAIRMQIKQLLDESLSMVDVSNTKLTKAQWQAWVDYRKKLEELHLQPGYPNEMLWPTKPE